MNVVGYRWKVAQILLYINIIITAPDIFTFWYAVVLLFPSHITKSSTVLSKILSFTQLHFLTSHVKLLFCNLLLLFFCITSPFTHSTSVVENILFYQQSFTIWQFYQFAIPFHWCNTMESWFTTVNAFEKLHFTHYTIFIASW